MILNASLKNEILAEPTASHEPPPRLAVSRGQDSSDTASAADVRFRRQSVSWTLGKAGMNLPMFKVSTVSLNGPSVELVGSVSSQVYGRQRWVGERSIGYLGRHDDPPIEGRWFSLGDLWKFITEDRNAHAFQPGESLDLFDGYWGERASIVLASDVWTEERFIPTKQWDHEHCGICWQTISSPGAELFYRNSRRDIVCPGCYQRYVVPRSLEFLEEKGAAQPGATDTPGGAQ